MFGRAAIALLMCAVVELGVSTPITAMDISIQKLPDGFEAVFAKGDIVPGDTLRLRKALQAADRDGSGNIDVVLNSDGGDVIEALVMAAVMDQVKVSTYVLAGDECVSACASILFFSGEFRVIFDGGRLGMHSCSNGVNHVRNDLCNEEIAENAFKHGIPYGSVMAFMVQRGPSEVAWFDSRDADCWGFTLWPAEYHRGIKPGEPAPCVVRAFKCATDHVGCPPGVQ
jgi:hypothetical protein